MPTVVPPSPEATGFAKYADVPVSLYTGTTDITIPLHNLECGNLSVPISLSYYASGIKVASPSTAVGIGWTLNAGGVISRSIRGEPEDPSNSTNTNNGLPISTSPGAADWATITNLGDPSNKYHSIEADIFYYNFNGISGSFYLKGTQVVLKKYDNIQIVPLDGGFVITTADGSKYYFQEQFGSSSSPATTDWYLSKIINANNTDTVIFQYEQGNPYIVPPQNAAFYWFANTSATPQFIFTPGDMSHFESTGLRISNITTSRNESVAFSSKNLVFDEPLLDTYKAIDEMTIYNSMGEQVKAFKFNSNNIKTLKPYSIQAYGYPETTGDYFNSFTAECNYRLYLDGVSEIGNDGSEIKHSFTYYGRSADNKDSLASRLSCAQDLGGLYNGQDANTTLCPGFSGLLDPVYMGNMDASVGACVDERYPTDPVNIPGANRATDFNSMRMGTLKSVTYPTGGTSMFEYSQTPATNPDTHEPLWGFKIDNIVFYDQSNHIAKKKHYEYSQVALGYTIPTFLSYTRYNLTYNEINPFPDCSKTYDNGVQADVPYYDALSFKTAVEISPATSKDIGLFEGPMIGYGHVEEIEDGNGRTAYDYRNDAASETVAHSVKTIDLYYNTTQILVGDFWPLGPYPYTDSWKRGTLLKKTTYKQNGSILSSAEYNYTFQTTDVINAIKVYLLNRDAFYLYYEYQYPVTYVQLDNIKETNDELVTITNYEYNNPVYKQKSRESFIQSNQRTVVTDYKYPYDFATTEPYNTMISRYTVGPVISKTTTVATSTQTVKTNFDFFQNNQVIAPSTVESGKGSSTSEVRLHYYAYDDKGNLLTVSKENDAKTSYIWGYNKTYPIAQVINALSTDIFYTSFEEGDGNSTTGDSKTGRWSKTDGFQKSLSNLNNGAYLLTWWSKIGSAWSLQTTTVNVSSGTYTINLTGQVDEVRFYPATAQMVTYAYIPSIGVIGQTDQKDRTTYYEYDAHNRLSLVRDNEHNILKKICYNYQGQVTNCTAEGNANWQATGNTRCKPCELNTNYVSLTNQVEQRDMNSSSPTYNQFMWVDDPNPLTATNNNCAQATDWQNTTTTPVCELDNYGDKTGNQLQEQKNLNPCSPLYSQTKWMASSNAGLCPRPSSFASLDESGNYYSQNCSAYSSPQAIYVSVPTGMFTSTISRGDANAQAFQYAQNYANQHGTCVATSLNVQVTNTTSKTFQVVVSSSGSTVMTITISPGSSQSISLNAGVYDIQVTVTDTAGGDPYNYEIGCNAEGDRYDMSPLTLTSISFNTNCSSITLEN